MKKLLLLHLFLGLSLAILAQDSWKVKVNSKVRLTTSKEDEKLNHKKVTAAEWKKNGYLEVIYKGGPDEKDWSRSIFLNDDQDNELIRKDGVLSIKIPLKQLRKVFAKSKKIVIYTTVAPNDPEVAARVRIRRVHLCTLELP